MHAISLHFPIRREQRTEDAQERCYIFIRQRIFEGAIRPGDRVVAQQVAQVLGVSRTPVREALSRLVQEGLVQRDEGWGFIVMGIRPQEVHDLYDLREVLELRAAETALERIDAQRLGAIDELLLQSQKQLRAESLSEFLVTSRRLHMAIIELSGNALYAAVLTVVSDRIHLLAKWLSEHDPNRPAEVLAENRAIVKALHARDRKALRSAIRLHLKRGRALTFSHLTLAMTQ